MPEPNRSDVIKADEPGVYHLTSRCVRKLFLFRSKSGALKMHRRKYILKRIKQLAAFFGISIGFQAIMENHLHLIVMTHPDLVKAWTDEEVIRRVCNIFPYKFRMLGVKDCDPTAEQIAEFSSDPIFMADMRQRLSSPSWLMRQLLQQLSYKVNREDGQEGHLVEKPFGAVPIVDEQGLLICGMYVDLNEVRAQLAASLEEAKHSSIGARIEARQLRLAEKHAQADECDGHLRPINVHGDAPSNSLDGIAMRRAMDKGMFEMPLDHYLKLLDAVARLDRPGKKGKTPKDLAPILERLNFNLDGLHTFISRFEELFSGAIGSAESLREFANQNGRYVGDLEAIAEVESNATLDASGKGKKKQPSGKRQASSQARRKK